MKIRHRQIMILTTIVGVVLVEWTCPCFGGNQESALMLEKKVIQNEDTWKTGQMRDYYAQASSIANDISATHAQAGINTVAATLLHNLMSKDVPPAEIGAEDLWIMVKITATLLSATDAPATDRQNIVQLLSKFLGRIRSEIVPNFVPKHVVANVPPPVGVTGAAGMDPEVISDPIAKSTYEDSIRENQENNRINSRQTALRRIDRQMSSAIIEYMIQTLSMGEASSSLVAECINGAGLNDNEKAAVLRGIDRRAR